MKLFHFSLVTYQQADGNMDGLDADNLCYQSERYTSAWRCVTCVSAINYLTRFPAMCMAQFCLMLYFHFEHRTDQPADNFTVNSDSFFVLFLRWTVLSVLTHGLTD